MELIIIALATSSITALIRWAYIRDSQIKELEYEEISCEDCE